MPARAPESVFPKGVGPLPLPHTRSSADTRTMKRMMIATDGSEGAVAALEMGADVAARFGAEVFVLHVTTNMPIGTYALFPVPDVVKELQESDEERAFGQARKALDAHNVDFKTLTRKGDPAEEILKAANELDIDAIVLGRRGLSTAGRWLVGSVSDRVVHGADRIVMLAGPVHGAKR